MGRNMIRTGSRETHKDDDYLMTGSQGFGTSTTLRDKGADFKSCGVAIGLFIENETTAESGYVKTVTEDEITVDGIVGTLSTDFVTVTEDWVTEQGVEWEDNTITWNNGDVYKIYKTSVKGCIISSTWTDRSRGWKTDPQEMEEGWRKTDTDLDKDGQKIFSPGQPEGGS